MRRVLGTGVAVLATVGVVVLLWAVRLPLALILLAIALTAAIRPVVGWLDALGIPRGVSVIFCFILAFLGLGALGYFAGGALVSNVRQLNNELVGGYQELRSGWAASNNLFLQELSRVMPGADELSSAILQRLGGGLGQDITGTATSLAAFLSGVVIIIILAIYWSLEEGHLDRIALQLVPRNQRESAHEALHEAEDSAGSAIRWEIIQTVVAFVVFWGGYRLLGIDYAVLLATIGALLLLVPSVGPVLAVGAPLLVCGGHIWLCMAAAAYTGVVSYLLARLWRRFSPQHPDSTLLLLIMAYMLVTSFGLFGVILAPVLAVVTETFIVQVYRAMRFRREERADLGERLQILEQQLNALPQSGNTEMARFRTGLQEMVMQTRALLLPEDERERGESVELADEMTPDAVGGAEGPSA